MSEQLGDPPNALTNPPGPATARDVSGERRVITVLFCDVVGSTSLASRFDPEEWAEVMNEAFRFMIAPVEEYGGTVARLMGDAVLAFFGAPLAHEDDPQRAVLAGLGIINGIQPFIAQFQLEQFLTRIDRELATISGLNELLLGLAPSQVLSSSKAINALISNYEARLALRRKLLYKWRRDVWTLVLAIYAEKNSDVRGIVARGGGSLRRGIPRRDR